MITNHICLGPPPSTPTPSSAPTPAPITTRLLMLMLMLLFSTSTSIHAATAFERRSPPSSTTAVRGCKESCGNITIPYPFGIGPNPDCFLNLWYNVSCKSNYAEDRRRTPDLENLFRNFSYDGIISHDPVEIISIDTIPVTLPSSPNTPLLTLSVQGSGNWFGGAEDTIAKFRAIQVIDLRGSPFRVMPLLNTLLVLGCNGTASLTNPQSEVVVGCTTVCTGTTNIGFNDTFTSLHIQNISGSCYGINCCQASIPEPLDYFQMEFKDVQGSSDSQALTLVANASYLASPTTRSFNLSVIEDAPLVLQWKVVEMPHKYNNSATTICSNYNDTMGGGYICRCKHDYCHGNPYLPQGCQVIKECKECSDDCEFYDNNTYECPIIPSYPIHRRSMLPLSLGLGISLGLLTMSIMLYGILRVLKARKEIRVKHNNFKRNGGLLLQQQMSSREGVVERIKIFTCDELERATDNFNENRILGRGGQGTVYKGMLPDGTIVAIKKSAVDEKQSEEFINEVVILSQINHRNVVKLFGCCLETGTPLLVYEFVPNGTLYEHIHQPREDLQLTWKMRLQIATESAEALRYFHSSSSTPIYHRDIKTSNILLDERYRAKIADFGISRAVSIDQTHVTTNLQGTWGYIDPEYLQSNQYTEKSDVYSFGVVLLELLSSKKPVPKQTSTESRSLVSEFLLCIQQGCLFDIVDTNVLEEAQTEVIEGFADLAKSCLSLNGAWRPSMKAVETTLQLMTSESYVPHTCSEEVFIEEDDRTYFGNDNPFCWDTDPSILILHVLVMINTIAFDKFWCFFE